MRNLLTTCCSAVMFACVLGQGRAEVLPCGLSSVQLTLGKTYPPIGRAAHVDGTVELSVHFNMAGEPSNIVALSGPEMLKKSAIAFIEGFRVNPSDVERDCAQIVKYVLVGGEPTYEHGCDFVDPPMPHFDEDVQHHVIAAFPAWGCDPSVSIRQIRYRFLMFHWTRTIR